jgi:tonB family C-terminal domain
MVSITNEYATVVLPVVSVTSEGGGFFNWEQFAWAVYGIVVCVLFLRLLWQIASIIRLKNRCKTTYIDGVEVYLLRNDEGPFSFFNWIFIHLERHSRAETDEIMTHELTHCRQFHSIDILCAELFCMFFWFNPFVWLLKREVRLNLEYLADRSVLDNGVDNKEYQYHLLGLTYRKNVATISNNFNVLPIKKRIKMMNKKKTNNSMRVKYVLYVPMIVMLLIVSNIDSIARSVTNVTVDNKVAPVSVLQKQKTPDNDQKVYTVVSEMPKFNGNLFQWLAQNIKYPAEASQKHQQGTVMIKFVVAADGRVRQAEIIRGASPSLDKEAMRIVSVMPKWIPGKQDGRPVAVYYTLPIKFKLSK